MKRINLLIAAIVIGYCNPANAQSVNDDTEITVTNEKGEKETIELPVSLLMKVNGIENP